MLRRLTARFLPALNENYLWRLLRENLREQARHYVVAVIAMIFVAASTSAIAWIMRDIIDSMTAADGKSKVFIVAAAVAVIFTVRGFATYLQVVSLSRAGNRIVARQQSKLFGKLLRQGVAFFNVTESSDVLTRVSYSAQSARSIVELFVTSFVRDLLTLAGLLVVMFWQQPLLSLVSLTIGPLAILGIRVIVRKVRRIMEAEVKSLTEITRVIQETSSGIRVIKAFALEDHMAGRMDKAIAAVERRNNAIARLQAITSPLMDTLSGLAIASVVALSAISFFGGAATTPGQLMSFVTALLMAYEPAKRLSRMRVGLESGMIGVRMMFQLLDRPETLVEDPDPVRLPDGPGQIVFHDVGFGYADTKAVLRNLNVTFESGKTTALVGPSGGGKSTILNLILRLYDPDQGRVTIDGIDVRTATFHSLREKISFVGQDTFLFSASVSDNIACGRAGAAEAQIIDAAKAANAHDFISDLPGGYLTEVGENGAFLSGGQKQRLAIARAILRNSEVLLLDEATSALDSESEVLVRDAIHRLSRGRTTIVIAHRLSTILNADKICVIDKGEIAEQGDAQTLLKTNGKFRTLFDHQFEQSAAL